MSKPTILAVDDDPTNLMIVAGTLSEHYEVKLATSGKKALEIIADSPPDLVLLDIMMPEMDGYEVCRRIKKRAATQRLPIIFLTAKSEIADEEQCFAVGAADFIHKPISPQILLVRVQAQLRLKEFEDSLIRSNSWLNAEVERRMGELQSMQAATIGVMVSLAEFRDDDTGSHIGRTKDYVRLLANALLERGLYSPPLTSTLVERMVEMMPLHDIGKIAIPDSILLKPGRLDPDEMAIMKTHSERGEEILSRCAQSMEGTGEYLRIAMRIARHHHERWDGSGYPDHLAGEAIPIEARIAAIADVYDALRTRRPYKPPFSHAEAWAQMKRDAGTHFDPVLIEMWLGLAEEVQAIADRTVDPPRQDKGK